MPERSPPTVALLCQQVMPWPTAMYSDGNFVFQPEGAPAHTANLTQRFLQNNIVAKRSNAVWPQYLQDLDPLDYGI
jgi:hypothetical protein